MQSVIGLSSTGSRMHINCALEGEIICYIKKKW